MRGGHSAFGSFLATKTRRRGGLGRFIPGFSSLRSSVLAFAGRAADLFHWQQGIHGAGAEALQVEGDVGEP